MEGGNLSGEATVSRRYRDEGSELVRRRCDAGIHESDYHESFLGAGASTVPVRLGRPKHRSAFIGIRISTRRYVGAVRLVPSQPAVVHHISCVR